ncbi:phytanoyl-CoA dioxygenase family protein [Catellatospora sp. KI3]|uniref:phytanoyl-CoA dioxygenase family protein n=1 Tax=Catellatospora sp. KI3 TaxID=3041620 RepID=UPI002482784B|nr:phytanoyl-CoA dioxygenase family protein [Catellatospora sp. KI3]MDI1463891.1 phytanoyl-CoA dioxygenase family protein [Catellatospora sp. KI3]
MWSIEQLRHFARDGYVVVPGVVPPDVVAAANARIDGLLAERPPTPGHTGHHFYFEPLAAEPALAALLLGTRAFSLAAGTTAPRPLRTPDQVQVALTFPPFDHRPGRGHIDGVPPGPDGRPGTFTLLAGFVLSDQTADDMGNLWVWPGTHRQIAAHFAAHGPDSLVAAGGYPPADHSRPVQVHAAPGDLVLASYLLSHNIGGNTSPVLRRTAYFRLMTDVHESTWRDCVRDELYEFRPACAD